MADDKTVGRITLGGAWACHGRSTWAFPWWNARSVGRF